MYNVPLVFQLWENPQKKSPMKRRCAIISCSQNINYINSRSQKTVTALVPDNKPITMFKMLEIPPPFPMHILNLSTNTWVGNTGYIRKMMNKTKGSLTITQTNDYEVSQTGHWHYLPTYQILMISHNVEFLPPIFMPCFGSHFENGRHLENF